MSATASIFIVAALAGITLAASAIWMLRNALSQRITAGPFFFGVLAIGALLWCTRAYVQFHPSQWYLFQRDVLYAAATFEKLPPEIREGRKPMDPPDHW